MKEIVQQINSWDKITILPHIYADGDCLGSSFALGLALKRKGKDVAVYIEEQIPKIYNFLPGKELVKVYNNEFFEPGLIIVLDSGDIERLGNRNKIFQSAGVTINIDHHPTNTLFGSYNFVDATASAVAEIVYSLLERMDMEIDLEIATCLYTAIITDTGGFKYSNTTAATHNITAELVKKGVDIPGIAARVFDQISYEKVKLMGEAIKSIEVLEDGKLSILTITEDMIKATGAVDEDTDGMVNIARNIEGVEVAVMLRQKTNNEIKVNLRSNGAFDVSELALKFSGGGHTKAAGCSVQGDIESIKNKFIKEIRARLNKLDKISTKQSEAHI